MFMIPIENHFYIELFYVDIPIRSEQRSIIAKRLGLKFVFDFILVHSIFYPEKPSGKDENCPR